MTFSRTCLRRPLLLALAACGALTACGARGLPEAADRAAGPGALAIAIEDAAAPDILALAADAAIAAEEAGSGLWAAVPGLARPERGLVRSPETGRAVLVALFRAESGTRISAEAAAALGLGGRRSAAVGIVAVRERIRLTGAAAGA